MNPACKDFSALAQVPLQRSYNCLDKRHQPSCCSDSPALACCRRSHRGSLLLLLPHLAPRSCPAVWEQPLQCRIRSGPLHRFNNAISSSSTVKQFLCSSDGLKQKSNKNVFPSLETMEVHGFKSCRECYKWKQTLCIIYHI